jgi:transposase
MVSSSRLQKRHAAVAAVLQWHGNIHAAAKQVKAKASFVQYWYSRYKKTGDVGDKQRKGRPSALTPQAIEDAEQLFLNTQSSTKATARLIQDRKISATTHRSTVYRNVVQHSKRISWGPEVVIPNITPRAARNRLEFATYHIQRKTEWCAVMAIDSTMFRMGRIGGRRGVWRLRGSLGAAPSLTKQGCVHAYAGITAFGKTSLKLVTGTTGMEGRYHSRGKVLQGVGAAEFQDVLQTTLVPEAEDVFDAADIGMDWQLLMDKAPPHTAASTKRWLQQHGIRVVAKWPGNSPDLNPIENLWGWMKKKIYQRDVHTVDELKQAIREVWEEVPDDMLSKLMCSMPSRLQRVVQYNGDYIGM